MTLTGVEAIICEYSSDREDDQVDATRPLTAATEVRRAVDQDVVE